MLKEDLVALGCEPNLGKWPVVTAAPQVLDDPMDLVGIHASIEEFTDDEQRE
jgi:hypothetical protein